MNICFWFLMIFGNGFLITFYCLEHSQRMNITDEFVYSKYGSLSYIIPRLFLNKQHILFEYLNQFYLFKNNRGII